MMRNYIDRARDFIKQIFPYIENSYSPWDVERQIYKFNNDFNRKVIVRSGLSRVALITSDYVIKFDYDKNEVESIGGCDNELDIYWQAKHEGFAYLFAEINAIIYNNRCFFIMPKVNGIGSGIHYAEHYMTEEEKDFCRRHRISDLHRNNYGFRRGHVCLVDYACHLSYETDYEDYEDYINESDW